MARPRIVAPDGKGPGAPVDARSFAALLAPLGPFEPSPRIAVAVSGGPDSLALCLLAARWAWARVGEVYGLTVDHRLRPESGAEAAQVRRWLAARGIAHRTLCWSGARPDGRIQERARAARLSLLAGWCRRARVLHLFLGHQREDQAGTVLQRIARGSGVDGLSAMAPVRLALEADGGGVRLLRPLLAVPREALTATLRQWGQPWLDDRSNRDTRHARPRLERVAALLEAEGLGAARLARTAARAAADRAALDRLCGALLARCARPSPAGFVALERRALREAPSALASRALARAIATVGGAPYPPRQERLDRLARRVLGDDPRAATLGGCRLVPRGGGILVCREPAAASEVRPLAPGERALWDRRFVVSLGPAAAGGPFRVRRLGPDGLTRVRALAREAGRPLQSDHVPAPARPSLPALFGLDGPLAVPHLGFGREARHAAPVRFAVAFRPPRSLAPGLPATLRVGGTGTGGRA